MGVECPKCKTENTSDSEFCKKCATPLPSSKEIPVTETLETPKEELTTGSTFAGRYQIIEELGKGGMGKVYKAQDTDLKEKVAIKLLKPEIAADKKLKFARKISHRNVCRMYDLNKEESSYYITMEYVPGEDLKSTIIRIGQLPIAKTISIAKQVCEGLEEAHGLDVVHRDLKPQNIMIDKEGNARVMDFGIARSVTGKGITGAGVMIGTPEYMSPEQVEGKDVDQRSDIYSLGVILYEMVTGRVPFEGETPLSIAVRHKTEKPQEPRELNTQIPEDLSRVILRCMDKDKEKRYQSTGEVRSELENIEKGIPTTERIVPKRKPITSREITVTFGLKRLFIPALVVIALATIAVVIWQLIPQKEVPSLPAGKASLAVMYFENRTDVQGLDKILVDMLTTNLSRIEGIEVVSSQRLFDILRQLGKQDIESIDKTVATQVATQAGVKTMLTGSIIKVGDKVRITSHLANVRTGAIIRSEQVEGDKIDEDVFVMVDDLTEKISTHLGLVSEGTAQELKITDVTTDSLEAYKHYQKGLDSFNRFRLGAAVKEFQEAIEADPTFAIAYVWLANAETYFGNRTLDPLFDLSPVRERLKIAKKYSHKATEKEQMMIDVQTAFLNREYELGSSLAQQLVEEYPDYKYGYYYLMWDNYLKLDFENFKILLDRILELDPTDGNAYNMLAYAEAFLNNPRGVISALKKYKAVLPDEWNPYDSAWETLMTVGRYDEAVAWLEEGLRRNSTWYGFHRDVGSTFLLQREPDKARAKFLIYAESSPSAEVRAARFIGYSFLFEGRFKEAEDEFRKAIAIAQSEEDVEKEIHACLDLGRILVVQGKYTEAFEEYKTATKLSWRTYSKTFNPIPLLTDYLIGMALVRKGDYEAAQSRAKELKTRIQELDYDSLYLDFYYLLMGEIYFSQRKEELFQNTIHKISPVSKLYSTHYHRLALAGYELRGDLKKAIEKYQSFYNNVIQPSYGLREYFYFHRESSLINYNIAKIYERLGDTEKAIEHYEKFLNLWRDADPGIPEVEDATKRLAGLKS